MYRKACDLGLCAIYRTNTTIRRIIRMGVNLPLLHHTLIPQGLEVGLNFNFSFPIILIIKKKHLGYHQLL
jgi:hypothetical protein